MSDRSKPFAVPILKNARGRRQTIAPAPSTSRVKMPSTNAKGNVLVQKCKNSAVIEHDVSIMEREINTDFEEDHLQIDYGKFLRAMLEECLLNEKIEREDKEMDIQMAQLADRYRKTVDILDKTNRRMKDIKFVVEQKRLLDLKRNDCEQFYHLTEDSDVQQTLTDLNSTEKQYLDRLETKNIDIGYDKESGHRQLLDAVNEAVEGFEQIKKHSKLDIDKFNEYEKMQRNLEVLEKTRNELDSTATAIECKFPDYCEKIIKEASEKIAKMMDEEEIST